MLLTRIKTIAHAEKIENTTITWVLESTSKIQLYLLNLNPHKMHSRKSSVELVLSCWIKKKKMLQGAKLKSQNRCSFTLAASK